MTDVFSFLGNYYNDFIIRILFSKFSNFSLTYMTILFSLFLFLKSLCQVCYLSRQLN